MDVYKETKQEKTKYDNLNSANTRSIQLKANQPNASFVLAGKTRKHK